MKKLYLLVPILAIILMVANITASNLVATTGDDLTSLELKSLELEQENLKLKQAIAQKSSLTYLKQLAQTQGYTQPTDLVYIQLGQPLAQR